MGILSRLFPPKKRGQPDPTDDYWYEALESWQRNAGQVVNSETAQRLAAVYACITAICESVAMLPVAVYEETDGLSRKRAATHWLFKLIHDSPNGWMDSFQYFETMQSNILTHGNAYAQLIWRNSDSLIEMVPLNPIRCTQS